MEEEEFSYKDFWQEEEKKEEVKINKEVETFSKGNPRKGIRGRYLKPKNYRSRKASIKDMKKSYYKEKEH